MSFVVDVTGDPLWVGGPVGFFVCFIVWAWGGEELDFWVFCLHDFHHGEDF